MTYLKIKAEEGFKKSVARFFFVVVICVFGLILHDHCKLAIKSFSVYVKVPVFNKPVSVN